jgi:hypothetical protein
MYFFEDPIAASGWAFTIGDEGENGGRIIPAFLNVRNPRGSGYFRDTYGDGIR